MDYPSIAREMLMDSYDLHMHTSPDLHPRSVTDYEAAEQAKEKGMAGILIKNHLAMTADRARLVTGITGFPVFGSITLNRAVGGLNADVVETALAFGAKEVWMPTSDGTMDVRSMASRKPDEKRRAIRLIDEDGHIVSSLHAVLEAIARYDVILGTGHISKEEAAVLIKEAKERGVKKIVVSHPQGDFMGYSEDDIVMMAKMGALIEHDYVFLTSAALKVCDGVLQPGDIARLIRRVGAENSILATDTGQTSNPPPVECMERLIAALLMNGITREEIRIMTRENPRKLIES